MMLNNNTEKNALRVRRKPVAAVARDRKKTAKVVAEGASLLTRKREIVIKRPVEANVVRAPKMSQRVKIEQASRPLLASSDSLQSKRVQMVNMRMSERKARINTANAQSQLRPTAQELKQQAISQALVKTAAKQASKKKKMPSVHFGFKRILLATFCAAVAVFAIVYFVNLNAPNISLKVAAMQSGIEASYPAYIPRDYALSDITSEDGKIVLNFKNASTESAFTLVEEKSSWDSNALLNNYVRETYGENYTLIREQGLALYISGSDATWVNGGVVYKLKATAGTLTKKQIKSIAVSL